MVLQKGRAPTGRMIGALQQRRATLNHVRAIKVAATSFENVKPDGRVPDQTKRMPAGRPG